jgi:hypothetical protein
MSLFIYVGKQLTEFSKVFEYRIKEAIALDPKNGGKFQITSYPLNIGKYANYGYNSSNPLKRG